MMRSEGETAFIVAFATVGNREEALLIAKSLVEERLAACVNILPDIESVYSWKGEVHTDPEVKLLIKTRRNLAEALIARIVELHSYEVCEVTCLPIVAGNPPYLDWLTENTQV